MPLLVLIACLAIERYLHIGSMLNRFSWLDAYLVKISEQFPQDSPLRKGFLGAIIAIAPIIIIVGILLTLVTRLKVGMSGLGMYFILLLYCFGPKDLYSQAEIYFASAESDSKDSSEYAYHELTGEVINPASTPTETGKKLTESLLVQANLCIYSVVCWYVIFGIMGVLFYRLIAIMADMAEKKNEICIPFAQEVIRLNQWIEWLPSRITALFYVLSNGFKFFPVWKSHVFSGTEKNDTIVIACGMASLHSEDNASKEISPIEENKKAIHLIDKALVIFVGLVIVWDIILYI